MTARPHPYAGCAPHQFWSQAMSDVAPGLVDPVGPSVPIGADDLVATMGSCFAQHISRHLSAAGCRYLVAETAPPGMPADAADAAQYGLFSARYGNVYTARQALQLFDRAFGRFTPLETAWPRAAAWVDPFRPRVEPAGHTSPGAVTAARTEHLACVRRVFTESRWLVLTLGLTEAWRDRRDGAVFPLAPGVAGGSFDVQQHEFVNFGIDDVRADVQGLVERMQQCNPACRLILTVSPVPLAATYERRHVWTSTSVSKAVLRVACDEAVQRHPGRVLYFPAYEVITSPAAAGRYYADDLRQVTETGIQHVMRLFRHHFLQATPTPGSAAAALQLAVATDVVCDEETIERSLAASRGTEA